MGTETGTSGRERARVEHCLKCNSTSMKNNMYFRRGRDVKVYVQCTECGEYVASYVLSGYTSECNYESFLHSLRFTRLSSGKRMLRKMNTYAAAVKEEFEHVLELVRTHEDTHLIENIIEEECSLSGEEETEAGMESD